MQRRKFIELSSLLSGAVLMPSAVFSPKELRIEEHYNDYQKGEDWVGLLTAYCDSLVELQIKDVSHPAVKGGVMCPLNVRVRGRVHEAVYPLMALCKHTGNEKYLDAARLLFQWSDKVSNPDGSWRSEPQKSWKGTTVFGVIAWADALLKHGDLLSSSEYERYLNRLKRAVEYVYNVMDYDGPGNINYPLSSAAALATAANLFNEKRYGDKARQLARRGKNYLTDNYFLFGEGNPRTAKSSKGLLPVDLAYNVEESLMNLVIYYKITNDQQIKPWLIKSLKAHLDFMIPDGGWDNSWGTRNYKWCYFGTRTADGCYPAYFLMADEDPVFGEAAKRNLELIKQCTHNGMLHGGPHHYQQGSYPSIHHTFTRAIALAKCLDYKVEIKNDYQTSLPREKEYGVKYYSELASYIISRYNWKATISAYDWWYMPSSHATGGALTLLWHKKIGPVFTASLNEYQEKEPANMELNKMSAEICLTPRLEYNDGNKRFMSCNDLKATLRKTGDSTSKISLEASGKLTDAGQNNPEEGRIGFHIKYVFYDEQVNIEIAVESSVDRSIRFYLPVVSESGEKFSMEGNDHIFVQKQKGKLKVNSNRAIHFYNNKRRIYNPVPGMQALPLYIKTRTDEPLKIVLSYIS
jgi:hypothetical protein